MCIHIYVDGWKGKIREPSNLDGRIDGAMEQSTHIPELIIVDKERSVSYYLILFVRWSFRILSRINDRVIRKTNVDGKRIRNLTHSYIVIQRKNQ